MPYTTLVPGTTITSSWANANVRDQAITPFASVAARDSAITSPLDGMMCVTTDTGSLWRYVGALSKWLRQDFTIMQTSDQAWTSNTTLADITTVTAGGAGGLGWSADINARYDFELRLHSTSSTGQLNSQLVLPTSATTELAITGVNISGTYYNTIVQAGTGNVGSGQYSTSSGSSVGGQVLMGGTAGTVKFQFAQVVSSASASSVLKGSSLRVRQIG